MQGSAPPNKQPGRLRLSISSILWGGILCSLLLIGAGFGVYMYKDIPTSDWRESRQPTPWYASGIRLDEAYSLWCNSEGHARMELRAAYYPSVRIQLGECKGSGHLIVRFANSAGSQAGETIFIPYENGSFRSTQETNITASGYTAEAHIETGFPSKDEYLIHKLTETSPLWRAIIWNRPAGSYEEQYLGFVCVLPQD